MTHDRREFLKLTLAGLGVAAHRPLVEAQRKELQLIPVLVSGQWALIRFKKANVQMVKLGSVKAKMLRSGANQQVQHHAWLAVEKRHVAEGHSGSPESIDNFWVWPHVGALSIPEHQAPPPATSVRQSSVGDWPDDPDLDSSWADPKWVADMRAVVPGYELVSDWQDPGHYESQQDFIGSGAVVGHRPCRAQDARAIWGIANDDGEVCRQSLTNTFGFMIAFPQGVGSPAVESRPSHGAGARGRSSGFSFKLRLDTQPTLHFISAPPKPYPAMARMRHSAGNAAYKYGDPLPDFGILYNLLKNGNGAIPRFVKNNAKPASDQSCNGVVRAKDLDIFCPPAQMDAP